MIIAGAGYFSFRQGERTCGSSLGYSDFRVRYAVLLQSAAHCCTFQI